MKTIKVSDELHEYLTTQGDKNETYDQIIKRLTGYKEKENGK